MSLRYFLLTIVVFTTFRADAQLFAPPTAPNQIVVDATNVIAQSAAMQDGLPQKVLADAQAVAIVPNTVRGAFVLGAQFGRGVLLVRAPGGGWQAPQMIDITGGSLGYQIGVQSTDLILIFRTPQSVANVMRGTLKVGVDASVAAGPVGRQASAATDLALKAEILSYSRTRGAFVGASIEGSSIALDKQADALYYQPPGTIPASATQLVQLLATLSSAGPPTGAPPMQPFAAVGAVPAVPQPLSEIEAAKQQLDAASRQLAANLDNRWKVYLALPPELYIPNHMPSVEELEQAIHRYEAVSQQPQYASLTNQPAFQATLKGLWRLGELQQGAQQKLPLPAPPAVR
jgi:lipid-binding SYLF domain-containing protein